MFRSSRAGIDASAYEYDARYQPQATEDRQDGSNNNVPRRPGKKPNYRPTPLRWYFVLVQILAVMALMGLVVWARQEMPNSDNSAIIKNSKRWMTGSESSSWTQQHVLAPITTSKLDAAQELRRAAEEFELQPRQSPSPNPAPPANNANTNPPAPPAAAPTTAAAPPPPAPTTAAAPPPAAPTTAAAPPAAPTTAAAPPAAAPTTAAGGNQNTVATQPKAPELAPTSPAAGKVNTVASEPPKAKDPPTTAAAPANTIPTQGKANPVTTPAGGIGDKTIVNPATPTKQNDPPPATTAPAPKTTNEAAPTTAPAPAASGPSKGKEAGITAAPSAGPKSNDAGITTPGGSAGPKSDGAGISTPGGSAGPKSDGGGISTPGSKSDGGGISTPGPKSDGGGISTPGPKSDGGGISTPGPKSDGGGRISTPGPKSDGGGKISTPGPKSDGGSISTPVGSGKNKGSVTSPSGSKKTGDDDEEGDQLPAGKNRVVTTVITSEYKSTITKPPTESKYTTSVPSTIYSTSYDDGEFTTYTETFKSTFTTKTRVTTVISQPGSVGVSVSTGKSTSYSVAPSQGDKPPKTTAIEVPYTETFYTTYAGTVVTTAKDINQEVTVTGTTVVTGGGGAGGTGAYTVIPIGTTRVASTGTVTVPGDTFIELGTTVITSVYTEAPRGKNNNNNDNNNNESGKENDGPTPSEKVIQVVSERPDSTVKQVKTLEPTVIVKTLEGEVETLTWSQPAETYVTQLPAYETTIAVVTTGWDGLPTTSLLVSTVSGGLTTIVTTPGPTVFTTTRSGKLTTFTSDRGLTTVLSTVKGTTQTYSSTTTVTPTSGPTDVPGTVKETTRVIGITEAGYFIGKFLPTMLSVLLSIPLRIIDLNAQLYQPFYAMNRPQGAFGADSMILHYSGFIGFVKPFQNLWDGHPVPFISMLIVWCSALLTPISAVAIGVKIHGSCTYSNPKGCGAALGVSPTPTHALLALMAFTIVLLCVLLWYLRNFETGLHANPWSIVGISSLATNREIRPQKLTERKIDREMAEKKYGFGYFQDRDGQTQYSIVYYDEVGQGLNSQDGNTSDASSIEVMTQRKRRRNPFMALGWVWRLSFLMFLLAVAILVLYYHVEKNNATPFKRFMNGQSFWVRFLFPSVGVIISFAWTTFFISVAMIVPYKNMAKSPQDASDSILITRPTNGFSGIVAAIKHNQVYPGVVALMAILSEFMPILLTNIPYTITQTYTTHVVCARIAISILLLMIITVVASFFINWPHMPVDPRSIAGAMYYVAESHMVDQFRGLATCDKHERTRRVKEMGGRYWFGEIVGKNGQHRLAVEREDDSLGTDQGFGSFPRQQMGHHRQNSSVDSTYYGFQGEATAPLAPPMQQQQQHQQHYYQEPYTDTTNTGYYGYQPEPTSPLSPQQQQAPQGHQNIDTGYYGYQPEPPTPSSPQSPQQQPAQLGYQAYNPGYYGHHE